VTCTAKMLAQFLTKVKSFGPGCWLWNACTNKDGYGRLGKRKAYQAAWLLSGREITQGLEFDHLCRNRSCVRPSHLELVTRKENILRGHGFGGVNSRKTHCPQGHEYTFENTYRGPTNDRRQCRQCEVERSSRRWKERSGR
jgi:hypothetical protein